MSGTDVVELDPDDPRWLAFATSAPGATAFHHPAWLAAIQGTYGFRSLAVGVLDGRGEVTAGLPLLRVPRLGRAVWVSLPFTDDCPPLASDAAGLQRLAAGLAAWSRHAAAPLEVRGPMPERDGWEQAGAGVRHVLPLDGGVEAVERRLPKPIRRHIRSARRAGLSARVSRSPDDFPAFYRLHLVTRRRLGAPIQPRRFLEAVWREMLGRELGFAVTAETAEGVPAGAGVFLAARGTLVAKYTASDPAFWGRKPNHLVLWTAIEWGCEHGCSRLDLGRSELHHESLRRFKSAWKAAEEPLVHATCGGRVAGPAGAGRLRGALAQVIRRSPPAVCQAVGELLYRYAG